MNVNAGDVITEYYYIPNSGQVAHFAAYLVRMIAHVQRNLQRLDFIELSLKTITPGLKKKRNICV